MLIFSALLLTLLSALGTDGGNVGGVGGDLVCPEGTVAIAANESFVILHDIGVTINQNTRPCLKFKGSGNSLHILLQQVKTDFYTKLYHCQIEDDGITIKTDRDGQLLSTYTSPGTSLTSISELVDYWICYGKGSDDIKIGLGKVIDAPLIAATGNNPINFMAVASAGPSLWCFSTDGNLNGGCDKDNDCKVDNSECINDFCECSTGFQVDPSDENKCIQINTCENGGLCNCENECSKASHCSDPYARCFKGKCYCLAGYRRQNGSCSSIRRCSMDSDCNDINAYCFEGKCYCMPGYQRREGICCPRQWPINCDMDSNCNDPYARCFHKKCYCLPGYHRRDGKCCPKRRCSRDSNCRDPYAYCFEGKCYCIPGYHRRYGKCCPKGSDCLSHWSNVYTNTKEGLCSGGSLQVLTSAVLNGANVRLCIDNYCTSIEYVQVLHNGELCGQGIFHISKADYKSFQDDAYHWFVLACTTGDFYMARYYVGSGDSKGDSSTTYDMKWFVRYPDCKCGETYSITPDGTVNPGSVQTLVDAVNSAADFRVVHRGLGFAVPLDNVAYNINNTLVTGQSIWQVSQKLSGDRYIYQSNAYWVFKAYSSDGEEQRSRWSIGKHVNRNITTSQIATDWYVDNCWRLAYSHTSDGTAVSGSVADLIDALEKGHKVKVVFDGLSVELNKVFIRNLTVVGQIINKLGNYPGTNKLHDDMHWDWYRVATTGSVSNFRYFVGNDTEFENNRTYRAAIEWFVDKRKWQKELTLNSTGVHGNKTNLWCALKNGAELRIQELDSRASYSVIYTVDNIGFEADGVNIGASHIRHVVLNSQKDGLDWSFTIVDTTGWKDVTRWTVGKHDKQASGEVRPYGTNWFITE